MTTTRREADVAIASIEVGDRMRKPDVPTIDELAKDLAERGVLQRIGVRERDDGKHVLIWGRHRYEAAAKVGWTEIPAVVFPADTPDRDMLMMEIVENLKRRELSEDEKREHTIRLAALIADAEPAPETRSDSEFPPKGPGGRGRKGRTAKVAEAAGVDPSAVRQRVKKAAEAIGEPVDIERDTPAELHAKADKVKRARAVDGDRKRSKAKPKKAEPSRETRSYMGSAGFMMRYTVPQQGDARVDAAWLRHAPLDEVGAWLRLKLGVKRASALAAALAAETGVLN